MAKLGTNKLLCSEFNIKQIQFQNRNEKLKNMLLMKQTDSNCYLFLNGFRDMKAICLTRTNDGNTTQLLIKGKFI